MAVRLASGLVTTSAADVRPVAIRRTVLRALRQPGSERGCRVHELVRRTHYDPKLARTALTGLATAGKVARDVTCTRGSIVVRWSAVAP
jgi:DNA-binding IclR family transcriptional regulator